MESSSSSRIKEKLEEATLVVEDVVVTDPVAEMEKILNYRFKHKNLLKEALAQSFKPKRNTGSTASLSERLEFQRLEFLGDAALGLAVASFIFITCPDIKTGNFSGIHKDNINSEKFARVAIQHGFYRYLLRKVPLMDADPMVRDFALVVQEDGNCVAVEAPKVLADIVESIAAAIYVDCEFDLKLFWECFGVLLEPCVTRTTYQKCQTYKVEKEDSEDKSIDEKLEKRNQLVETKKRKRETGSEVSAEKVKGDMAINEKLEKKSNKLVGTKKRKMENGSEVSADKVKVDIAINKKLEKKTKKENGGDVSAEKVEQLFAEENSSMKITCQSNIQENSKKYALIYTIKHMDTRLSSVAEVEEILSYRFRNKSLLEEALTHSSYSSRRTPDYERRLEFVGRTVLSLAVSNFVFITYPDLEPHQLTQLREANLNTEKLARVAIRHGFYRYLRCNSPVLDAKVRDFALVVQEEGDGVAYGEVVKPPVILAEIVRSIAAAIFVDCEFDFKLLWKYFCGLLEPLVTLDTFQQQPVSMLYALCHKERKHIDVKYSRNGSQHTVSYNVNGKLVGSGCSNQKYIAKITAAREALKLWNSDSSPMDVGSATVNDVPEIDGAKQKLNELCSNNGWQIPIYKLNKFIDTLMEIVEARATAN